MLPAYKPTPVTATTLDQAIWQLNRLAEAISLSLNLLLRAPDSDKVVTGGIALIGGVSFKVAHRLARQPQGWRVVDITGGALAVHRVSWDARFITLQNTNTCVVAIEVW